MPKVSRIQLDPKVKKYIQQALWKAAGYVKPDKLQVFWGALLSPTEVVMLSKRLAILKMLVNKKPYAEIKEQLRVTEGTIAKMSAALQSGGEEFRRLIQFFDSKK